MKLFSSLIVAIICVEFLFCSTFLFIINFTYHKFVTNHWLNPKIIHNLHNLSKFSSPKDVGISVMAVLNDSTGTLMSCAHKNLDCRIGVIIGKKKYFLDAILYPPQISFFRGLSVNGFLHFCVRCYHHLTVGSKKY